MKKFCTFEEKSSALANNPFNLPFHRTLLLPKELKSQIEKKNHSMFILKETFLYPTYSFIEFGNNMLAFMYSYIHSPKHFLYNAINT